MMPAAGDAELSRFDKPEPPLDGADWSPVRTENRISVRYIGVATNIEYSRARTAGSRMKNVARKPRLERRRRDRRGRSHPSNNSCRSTSNPPNVAFDRTSGRLERL